MADGRLGVGSDGGMGSVTSIQAADASATYVINVDARGASDPAATAALVQRAVAATMAQVVPGIVDRAARQATRDAQTAVFDAIHRQDGRF